MTDNEDFSKETIDYVSKLALLDLSEEEKEKFAKQLAEIIAYFKGRNTSGFVEGFNNKVKVLKRRCYGIFDENSLFRRLFLDCTGYEIFLTQQGLTAC